TANGGHIVKTMPRHARQFVSGGFEGRSPRQHLVKDAAEKINIAPEISRLNAGRLFEAGIVNRAHSLVMYRIGHRTLFSQASIHKFGVALRGDENICQFDVAVADASCMSV